MCASGFPVLGRGLRPSLGPGPGSQRDRAAPSGPGAQTLRLRCRAGWALRGRAGGDIGHLPGLWSLGVLPSWGRAADRCQFSPPPPLPPRPLVHNRLVLTEAAP